ncbi:possible p-aminobenzoate synthetase [Prochlorococcus marinus str. MIT 9515]|uniref:Possible p-aminobenzoate synthetase n=1 Tax=Prochlorococcus marinus (strain MIT 9515) TaxID=167542 RepID=A2BZ79_PROM5|nr:anthranilate synthase component I family protein [Prochlorococcus marinus]ABM73090.1 possible p-aminobenzoate synthetase [Prochlorococcus marinus str. MIT 9515]
MNIKTKKLSKWIDPELIANHLALKFGEHGLSWLDSDGKDNGKWSIMGVNPKKIISSGNINNLDIGNNPFLKLKKIEKGFWIGWLNFEAGAYIEPKNPWKNHEISTLWIASYDPIIKFNLISNEILLEGTNSAELSKYEKIIYDIDPEKEKNSINKIFKFDFSKINLLKISNQFQKNILRIKQLISIGDIFQANLTTKCEVEALETFSYLNLYLKIRSKLPAPFGGIIINKSKGINEAVLSTSPERFLKIDKEGYVESRPIKGTRSRHQDENQDALNAIDLITNEKDRAENIMIVDLLRNDLSKVCEVGSIEVPEILKLESYLKVHHLTSVIRGKLKKNKSWVDLLIACWPGGSITGAPKLRSCQRLFEIENSSRGPYCGSFIKLDWHGEFDSNILIRSFIVKNQKIQISAGCGIVNDSDPKEELNELKWKLLPLIDSLK